MVPLLVGRAGELEVLNDAGRRLTTGVGGFVHVVGEAGIGKTSLLASVNDLLRGHDVNVRVAAADETDRRRPLLVLRTLLPEMELRRHDPPVDAAIAALERLAADRPVALLVDDLHWADDATVDALRAIARRAAGMGVLLVTTTRPQAGAPALGRLEELARADGVCLTPAPLGTAELLTLVDARVGAPPGPRLVSLLAGTAGNPFLAVELLTSLIDEGQVAPDGDVAELTVEGFMPGGLSRRLAMRTLSAVPDGALVLRAVAAVPGGATSEELAVILERSLSDVLGICLAAVDLGILVDTGTALAFRHDLLSRSVMDATPPSILRTLSRRTADVLLERRADPERVTACLLAGSDPDDPSDVDRLITAGTSFREQHPSAAADLLRRALEAMTLRDPRATAVTLELGWALVAAGRAAEVDTLLADRVGPFRDEEPIAFHRLRGIAASLTGRIDLVAQRYADADLLSLIERYDANDAEVVDAIAELALLRVSTGKLREAATIVEWAESSPAPASAFRSATVATVRSWLAAAAGRFEEGVEQARRALSWVVQDETGSAAPATPTLTLAISLDQLGDSEGSLAASRGRVALLAVPRWGPPLLQFFTALTLYRRGEWDDALAEVEAGLVAADETDLGMGTSWPYAVSTLITSARGRQDEAHAWLDRATSASKSPALGSEWLVYATALVAEADGDPEGAGAIIEMIVAAVVKTAAPALLLNGGTEMVRLCLLTGRTSVARQVSVELRAMASRTASPVVAALADWAEGLVDGRTEKVAAAADALSACRRTPESARAQHHAAMLAAKQRDSEEARRLAKSAFAAYDALEAEHWHRQLRTELLAAKLVMRPRRGAPRPLSGWASLTASEQTIVGLVGEGLTNTDIAARLYVSRRTVESHLGRVYAKLDLATRTQLVAASIRRPAL